ncbi:MAG: YqgE/AlgH family protein [Planctomycetota bacterium]
MESIQGFALVASPHLADANFLRSVVYILRHDEDGALGLILNRPTLTEVGELMNQLGETSISSEQPVYCGGPVDGPLVMLQSVHVDDHLLIAVASDQEQIMAQCGNDSEAIEYRLFDGYAGWAAGQLEGELNSGGWLVWDIQPEEVFSDAEELWSLAIRSRSLA